MTFLKYFSAATIVCAICLHALNIHPLNVIIHLVGACTWSVVGFAWKEKKYNSQFPPTGVYFEWWLDLQRIFLTTHSFKRNCFFLN